MIQETNNLNQWNDAKALSKKLEKEKKKIKKIQVSILSERRECIAYMESTVVDISIPPPSFKPVSLSSPRSPLSKNTQTSLFFNVINIWSTFTAL